MSASGSFLGAGPSQGSVGLGGESAVIYTEADPASSPFSYRANVLIVERATTPIELILPNQGATGLGISRNLVLWDDEQDLTFSPDPFDATCLINGVNASLTIVKTGFAVETDILVINTGNTWKIVYHKADTP